MRDQKKTTLPPGDRAWSPADDFTTILSGKHGKSVGSSSPVLLSDGTLVVATTVASSDGDPRVRVSQSIDGGKSWRPVAMLPRHDTAVLFEHKGVIFALAMNHAERHGSPRGGSDLDLYRSSDAGETWSGPVTLFRGRFWNVHTGFARKGNVLYWAVDDHVGEGTRRGPRVVAADLAADLADPAAWRLSSQVPFPGLPDALVHPRKQAGYPSQRMLEPAVLNVNGRLRVLAAVKPPLQATTGLAAVFDLDEGRGEMTLSFTQYHPLPGGQLKFCLVRDEISGLFWLTCNLAADGQDCFAFSDPEERRGADGKPYNGAVGGNDRRFLMLFYGLDGLNWFPAGCIARADRLGHSFMYPSAIIAGTDLLVFARSSLGRANRHDGDHATFHRVRDFRRLAMNLRQDMDG